MPTYEESLEETPVFDHDDGVSKQVKDELLNRQIDVDQQFKDQVAIRVATLLGNDITQLVMDHINAKLEAVLDPIVMNSVTQPLQPTDAWGNPRGEPVTLLQYIQIRVDAWFDEKVDPYGHTLSPDDARYAKGKPRLEWMVAKVVDAVADDKLRKTIDEQVKMAKDQLGAKVTGMVGDAVRKVFGLP